jgi:hypothetical protein
MADYLDYLMGLGETGATLGSGAAAGLLGMPYGVYKGATSGKLGTREANRIAEEEARRFMEQYTYQPRGNVAPAMLQSIGGLLESSKLPPVIPEVGMLASIPRQAYAAQAERAGRAAERKVAPMVERTMKKGGVGAGLLSDLAQGTTSNIYLPVTPKNPNPLVGTRYKTQYVGNLAPRSPFNLEDYEGYSLLTFPSDITSRGEKVTEFSDITLNRPIITEGGFAFPRDIKNIQDLRAYASMLSAAQRQNNRVFKALEENKNLGGREKVLVAPHTMAYGAEDFSTMPTDALLSLYETVGAKKDVVDELNKRIREATVKGEKGKFSEFVGLRDKSLRDQLFTGAGLTKGSAGDLRKLFTEKMGSVYGEKAFGYNYPDLRRSLLDPNLADIPKYSLGETFYEAMPEIGLLSGAHSTYSHGMPGVYKGTLKSAPVKDVFGDKYQQIYEQTKAAPKVASQLAAGKKLDLDQLTMGALSSGESGTSLFLDAKTIKRLKKMMQD